MKKKKNYFIIKNEMKKVTFLYVRLWMNKKKLAAICYGPYLKLNWLINTTMMNMIRFYKVFLFMLWIIFSKRKCKVFFRNWERNFINVPTTTTITSRFKITKRKCVIIQNNNTMCFSTWTILAKTREKNKHKEKRNQTSKIWHNLSINESVQIEIILCLSYYFSSTSNASS